MRTPVEKKEKRLVIGFVFALVVVGALFLPYALPVAEPARIFVLGAALLVLAIWGRRAWSGKQTRKSEKSLSFADTASYVPGSTAEAAQELTEN